MSLDTSVPGFPEMDDWPTAPVPPVHIKGFGCYRDGGPRGGTFYVDLQDSAWNVFSFFFDRYLGRLCYGYPHDGDDDAAFIRKGSQFESGAFRVIEASALAPEFSEIADRLTYARRWTDQR